MKLVKVGALALALSLLGGCALFEEKKDDSNKSGGGASSSGGGASGGGAAAGPDMRDYMQAMSPMMMWPKNGSGMSVGMWVEQKTTGPANSTTKWAVVEDAGEKLKVEMSGTATQGFIEGLVINKADGKVLEAWAGKKGEKPKKIKIMEMPAQSATPPPATDEDCTVAAGTFKCKKIEMKVGTGTMTMWSGCDGDGNGLSIKIKSADGKGDYELKSLAAEDMTVAGKSMKTKHCTYSNGSEMWMCDAHPPFVSAAEGMCAVKTIMSGMTTELNWGDGAKPEMDWANAK